jgi:serine/threonine-protein kinase
MPRYNTACAAALAGCGKGQDADKLGDTERARLRRQALDWLQADLEAWRRRLDGEPDKFRPVLAEQMRHWLDNADFAEVRGPAAIAKLPEAERPAWQQLWKRVTDTLAELEAKTAPRAKSK